MMRRSPLRSVFSVLGALALAVTAAAADDRPVPAKPKARAHAKAKPRAKPATIDVAAAMASGDLDRQCGAALALVDAGQHARASLLIDRCATVPTRADAARAARIAIAKVATRDAWSQVEIAFRGDAVAPITIDAFPDVPVAAGTWKLPAGTYHFAAIVDGRPVSYDLTIERHSRALVLLEASTVAAPPVKAGVVDFTKDDGGPIDAPIAGPPPKAKHESLLPARYRPGMQRCGAMACRKTP